MSKSSTRTSSDQHKGLSPAELLLSMQKQEQLQGEGTLSQESSQAHAHAHTDAHTHAHAHTRTHTQKVVLVTGGAGFIGSHVADMLLARGDRVVIVDEMNDYYDVRLKQANLTYLFNTHGRERCSVHRGDICDVDFIADVFEQERPTHVCHLAARAGVRPSIADPYIYVHSNVEGTTRLLDLARQYLVQNFVYASSSSVYGCSDKHVLSEKDVVEKPVSPYAATKKACELLAYTFHHLYGLNCTGLRFFTVYGPRGRPDMAPFKFIDRVFRGEPIQQYGDGSTSRDYTFIDDIARGVVNSIDRPLGYEVINLGNGRPYLLRDFIALVEKSVGRDAVIEVMPEQPGDVDRTCADIGKARELLDYNPQVPFEEGIQRMVDWYKDAHARGLFVQDESEEEEEQGERDGEGEGEDVFVQTERESERAVSVSGEKAEEDAEHLSERDSHSHAHHYHSHAPHTHAHSHHHTHHAHGHTHNRSRTHSHSDSAAEKDLELSSYVQKACKQMKHRTQRIFLAGEPDEDQDV